MALHHALAKCLASTIYRFLQKNKKLKKKRFMKEKSSIFQHPYCLTDGGLETTLIFLRDILPNYFAAFELLQQEDRKKALEEYYLPYLRLAEKYNLAFILETPTWRANADWGFKLGYTPDELFAVNKQSVKFIRELAQPFSYTLPQIIFSGNIGPRGDGYKAENIMNAEQAKVYHFDQVNAFALADADIITAATINYSDEAIGIINAARLFQLPVVISFTVETDGKLPGGESLQEAIEKTDKETNRYAEHFMINCAHPQHFLHVLQTDKEWKLRLRVFAPMLLRKAMLNLMNQKHLTLETSAFCLKDMLN